MLHKLVLVLSLVLSPFVLARVDCEKRPDNPNCQPSEPESPYPVELLSTGQTVSLSSGDDGDLELGIPLPNSPRFVDNQNGTVTDTLTNLTWLKDAGCIRASQPEGLLRIDDLNNGFDFSCAEYIPGSLNDWRMPNIRELGSIGSYAFDAYGLEQPGFLSDRQGTGPWSQGNPFYNYFGVGTETIFVIYYSSTVPGQSPSTSRVLSLRPAGELEVTGGLTIQGIWPVRGPSP